MAYNDPQLLYLDRMLTNVSVHYVNDDLVAGVLAPPVRVSQQTDKWHVFERRAFHIYDDRRAPGGVATELPPRKLSRDSFFAEEHAIVDVVAREEPEAAAREGLDPLADSTEQLSDAILLKREKLLADLATTIANFATGHSVTLSGTSQWSDYANSVPISDSKTGRDRIHKSIVKKANLAVASYLVAVKLEDHPDFIERIKYSQRGVTTAQIIAQVLDVGRYVIAGALINTATPTIAEPGFDAASYLFAKDFVMAFVPPRPSQKMPAFAYEFVWPYRRGVRGAGGRDMPTERWYDNDRDADKIRVRRRYDIKGVAVDAVATGKLIGGYIIKAAVA